VTQAGLPTPAMNHFVAGHEIDAWWEAERFGVELDVYETHGSRLSFEEDRVRDDELLLAGIETTRVTGPRLDREPEAVVGSLRRHLARRAPIK
jgi:very-short-patch-repair endonuclease